jgi:hypothetical protein
VRLDCRAGTPDEQLRSGPHETVDRERGAGRVQRSQALEEIALAEGPVRFDQHLSGQYDLVDSTAANFLDGGGDTLEEVLVGAPRLEPESVRGRPESDRACSGGGVGLVEQLVESSLSGSRPDDDGTRRRGGVRSDADDRNHQIGL